MRDSQVIEVRGAREHNLRNVDLVLPRNQLIVFTGVSGSGKSSLAFDTLYAEGQRRYVESLSSYARQFLGQLPKPDADYIGGLSPAISIQQKTAGRNPRSTVGTITEVSDFLRVLYARIGQGHCPQCQQLISAQSREQIIARVMMLPPQARFSILAPVARGQKGEFRDLFSAMQKRGYVRVRVDGEVQRLTDDLKLDKRFKHTIEVVIDRLKNDPKIRPRLAEAIEQAMALSDGTVIIAHELEDTETPEKPTPAKESPTSQDLLLSAKYACTHCSLSYDPPTPQLFSFNSPLGMCLECDGLGTLHTFDPELLIPNPGRSVYEGAFPIIGPLKGMGRWRKHIYEGVAKSLGLDLKLPWKDWPDAHKQLFLYGSGSTHIVWEWKQRGGKIWRHAGVWEGVIPQLRSQFKKTAAGPRRMQLERYMRSVRCPHCQGHRLNPQARAVRINDKTLIELGGMPISELAPWIARLSDQLTAVERHIAQEVVKEIQARLQFLLDVGLDYLSLDRTAPTLSGGEAQRIRLAGQIGSGLVGVLYILDEPSIGLHPRDNERLLRSLERLRDMGNTVLVVEHDEETMRRADFLVDFGPGPGTRGGEIVAAGSPQEVFKNPKSLTGQYLSGQRNIAIPDKRRSLGPNHLRIVNARHHNLKNITVDIPLGLCVCITGVSGSGKSSLINDVLREALLKPAQVRTQEQEDESENGVAHVVGLHDRIEGTEHIDKLIDIDQSPIGRTPRSNPATYIKVWDEIRSLYAQMSDAKVRGYAPGRFSFNRPGGRCEACEGNGANRLEMDFLADIWVTCPVCDGKRFNRETLQVKYRGKSIFDVLEMEVAQALEHFEHIPKIHAMLSTLHDVGLDYIKLGQPSPTLSGGEAQRIKLAKELCRTSTGKTLYILDEPTTGLHFEDVRKLLEVLHDFVDRGNTVVVIEHDLDVIKTADWVIDLGPEGGSAGGEVIAQGPPEAIVKAQASYTGQALAKVLAQSPRDRRSNRSAKTRKKATAGEGRITHLEVQGAQQHNLKNVSVRLPRDKMNVFCGPSGSGKSTLAIDTIYAEGQRRYVESLSSYARQFLGQVQKPKVEHVTGLSPAISIEQKTTSKSPRSTVGTITEIYDYLRILYARLGQRHCPKCNIAIGTQTADTIIEAILGLPEGTKLYVLAPLERKGQEKYDTLFEEARRSGFVRMRVDGRSYNLDEPPTVDHRRHHTVEIVVDRNIVRPGTRTRIAEAVEQALDLGRGVMKIALVQADAEEPTWPVQVYSQHLACNQCGTSYEPLNPHHYSFNSSLGWCPVCEGLGVQNGANVELLIRDPRLSLRQGALMAWPTLTDDSPWLPFANSIARHAGFSLDTPFGDLEPRHQRIVLLGSSDTWLPLLPPGSANTHSHAAQFQYKGVFPALDEASRVSFVYRSKLEYLVDEIACSSCQGDRIRSDAAATRFGNLTLGEFCALPLHQAYPHIQNLGLTKQDQRVAGEVLREITARMSFLLDVGLDYLSLNRPGPTLSGGEAQRIRLASQIGTGLTGVLYVLDEPTIGLHPRDNKRLLQALERLRDLGNTLLVVEHDREVIGAADYLVDFGPGAGDRGGEITAAGTVPQVQKTKNSLTGQYLRQAQAISVPANRRTQRLPTTDDAMSPATVKSCSPKQEIIGLIGARQHNLKNIDVYFPLGAFIAVTGVSGSGKSTLVTEVLYNTLARKLHRARTAGAAHDEVLGLEHIDKIISVDQDPIGNSPSSNPATYSGVFDLIRELFARLPESKVRGYPPRRFSFNQKGGRCEACEGMGQKRIEMHFLPDVWVECEECKGKRYNPETLAVQYGGKSINDILEMRIEDALEHFKNIPKIRVILQTLVDVGLGYMALGQAAPTMSGGEAQRVKLAAELARPSTGKTLYILDEPTTGLHFDDVRKLLEVLHRLVDLGNTVIVVEHNLDVIKNTDWIIDMGPEAGNAGGQVVAQGTPEDVVAQARDSKRKQRGLISHTGNILTEVLREGPHAERARYHPGDALAQRDGDLDIADVGKAAQLPWEEDGPRWHTQDRITTTGKAPKWEGVALASIVEFLHEHGNFSPTQWNHRSVVEIAAPVKSQGWFLHAMTGHEAYLKLVFRVARNSFKLMALESELSFPALSEYPGLEGYARDHRVEVNNLRGPWQEVVITIVKVSEARSPAMQTFMTQAIAKFQLQLERLDTKVEDLMPWKLDGMKWHLSTKGFPPGKSPKWDQRLISVLIEQIEDVDPHITIDHESAHTMSFRVPEIGRAWCMLRTKMPQALELRLLGKPGQFNLNQLDGLGVNPELSTGRKDGGDTIILQFTTLDHLRKREFRKFLVDHLRGFRAQYQE